MNLENLHPAINPNEGFKVGLAERRQVLGGDYVEASLAKVDNFMAPLRWIPSKPRSRSLPKMA